MAFLFNPCSPCCTSKVVVCDGWANINNSCQTAITGDIFPSYLGIGTGQLMFELLDISGGIISTCFPLAHSGSCEFIATTGNFYQTGSFPVHNNALNLLFDSSLNTPTVSGYLLCAATGHYNVSQINKQSIANPCWWPSGIVNVSFTWNTLRSAIVASNGLTCYQYQCNFTGGSFTPGACCVTVPPCPSGSTQTITLTQTQYYLNIAANPITTYFPVGSSITPAVFLYEFQYYCQSNGGSPCTNISGVNCGTSNCLNIDQDIYIYFTVRHDCNSTQIVPNLFSIPHGSSIPTNLYPYFCNGGNGYPQNEIYEWGNGYGGGLVINGGSGITSCKPLLLTVTAGDSAHINSNAGNCYAAPFGPVCGFSPSITPYDTATLSE